MGMNDLAIRCSDSPDEAPHYKSPEYRRATLDSAHVVGKGTMAGNPTVDLIFQDETGQKYVAMVTGGIIAMLNGAVQGMKERTNPKLPPAI